MIYKFLELLCVFLAALFFYEGEYAISAASWAFTAWLVANDIRNILTKTEGK